MRHPQAKLLALVIIFGAIIVYAFFMEIGPQKMLSTLRDANPAYLLAAVSIFIASYASTTLSLWHILGKKPGKGFLLRAQLVGYALNNITPTSGYGGDIAKAEILARRTKEPRAKVFAGIVVQNILHISSIIVALVLSAAFLASKNALGDAAFLAEVAVAVAVLFAGITIIFVSRKQSSRHIIRSILEAIFEFFGKIERRFLPTRVLSDAKKAVIDFHFSAHSIFWRKSIAIPAAFTSATFIFEVSALYLVLLSLGQHMAIPAITLSYAVAIFAGMLPITFGGLGTYDAALAWMLFLFGTPLAQAGAASLLFRLIQYWMTNALGIATLVSIDK